ncbi:ABC transporter ATP-binding protein [Leptolyngbya iicbica]|nr:ABC transporter ATP-binding protein [Leptolyngbya sp. LK]
MYISFLQRGVLAAQSLSGQLRSQPLEFGAVSPGQPAIAARHISMEYATKSRCESVLKDINLTLEAGRVHLLMGPSGSGKTTLLSILGGILTPTAGEVDLLGCCITRLTPAQRSQFRLQNLGFVFQGFNLFPALTAAENIEVVLNLLAIDGDRAQARAIELLDLVGIAHKANSLPEDLSGGQKQRVAIARALAHQPKLILADEPTAALDRDSGATVIQLLQQLAEQAGATVLIVTHDPRLQSAAHRVIDLEDGQLR